MNLELKHLAPYLPFGLKWAKQYKSKDHLYEKEERDFVFISIMTTLSTEMQDAFLESEDDNMNHAYWGIKNGFKPLLRPLSDLTKEIEHNGERFVPFEKLFEDISSIKSRPLIKEQAIGFNVLGENHWITTIDGKIQQSCFWWIIQKLFEWRFDIFSLIPAGLALDIDTLK